MDENCMQTRGGIGALMIHRLSREKLAALMQGAKIAGSLKIQVQDHYARRKFYPCITLA